MSQAMKIAAGEWTHLLRTRLAVLTLGLLFALVAIAAINSSAQLRAEAAERLQYQQQADEAYRAQPDRLSASEERRICPKSKNLALENWHIASLSY